jgi:hypothetical protein
LPYVAAEGACWRGSITKWIKSSLEKGGRSGYALGDEISEDRKK